MRMSLSATAVQAVPIWVPMEAVFAQCSRSVRRAKASVELAFSGMGNAGKMLVALGSEPLYRIQVNTTLMGSVKTSHP
jgi:hypothetical protein